MSSLQPRAKNVACLGSLTQLGPLLRSGHIWTQRSGEAASYECDLPASAAAEQRHARASTVFLEHPKADSILQPVSHEAGRLGLVKDLYPSLYFFGDDLLGRREGLFKTCVPGEGVPWLEESMERQHAVSHAEGI